MGNDGRLVAWAEGASGNRGRVQVYDRDTEMTSTLWETQRTHSLHSWNVNASADWVVWSFIESSTGGEAYGYNTRTGQSLALTGAGFIFQVAVSGGKALLATTGPVGKVLRLWDLDNGGTLSDLATATDFRSTDIDGNRVVYNTGTEAVLLDLGIGVPETLPIFPSYDIRIAGDWIAYFTLNDPANKYDLYVYSIPGDTSSFVASEFSAHCVGFNPFDISDQMVVWGSTGNDTCGEPFFLYTANLTTLEPTPTGVLTYYVMEASGLSVAALWAGPDGATWDDYVGIHQTVYRGPPAVPGRPFPKKRK
jgi:hypothetical protein